MWVSTQYSHMVLTRMSSHICVNVFSIGLKFKISYLFTFVTLGFHAWFSLDTHQVSASRFSRIACAENQLAPCSHFGFKPMDKGDMGPWPAPAEGAVVPVEAKADGDEAAGARSLWEASQKKADSNAKPKRQLKRKSTEEQVEKSLYDNFRSFTPTEIDGVVHEGKTLRQRLHDDKNLQKTDPKAIVMGQRYYTMLRNAYASQEQAIKRLQVKNPDLPVAPPLMKAMIAVQAKSQNNRGALVGYLSTALSVNQKEPKTPERVIPLWISMFYPLGFYRSWVL